MDQVDVGLVGLGTVGTGVARILRDNADVIASRTGRRLRLAQIVDIDVSRAAAAGVPRDLVSPDLNTILDNPNIRVAVAVVGGLTVAREIITKLLASGKSVVTANKALLATHGRELFETARRYGQSIAFEASVGGGIPIIGALLHGLAANRTLSIAAIVNGTCNFILTQMQENDTDYASALAEAQQRGYAEANPAMDVNGSDAAQKLAILAHLAFGARVKWRDIPRTGIDVVDVMDIRFAKELGYSIKLLAVAELVPEGLELHVSPTLVRHGTPLAEVRGAYNAIRVVGDAVGRTFFHGLGAGQMPTASAVVADLIGVVAGRAAITFRLLNLWSDDGEAPVRTRDPAKVPGRFYLRFGVDDRPGVMSEITGILGSHHISIASVIQHETEEEDASNVVPLVIMTHATSEGNIAEATKMIGQLASVHPGSVRMRVRD